MSEQLGFLLLLLVVGTCNLLLGFVLAAHVGRLRLQITWIAIEITAEQMRGAWQWTTGWVGYVIPYFRKKEAAEATVKSDEAAAESPSGSHDAAHEPAHAEFPPLPEHLTKDIDAQDIENAPSPWGLFSEPVSRRAEAELPSEDGEPVAALTAEVSIAPEPQLSTKPKAGVISSSQVEVSTTPQAEAPIAQQAEVKPAPRAELKPSPEPEVSVAREEAAAPQAEVAPSPAEEWPSFDELASQLEGDLTQLRAEVGQVLKSSDRELSHKPSADGNSGNSAAHISPDSSPSLQCAVPDEMSWEAQLQQALQDNLADLQAATRTLQAASSAQSSSS